MADPITVTDLTQVGRLNVPDPNTPPVYVSYNADFSSSADVTLDFTIVNQQMVFGVPRTMFIDNGSNPNPVGVAVTGTDQYFTVPSYSQGIFALNANQASRIQFTTDGGAEDTVTITIYNYVQATNVWYSYGAFNNNKAVKVEGTMQEGDVIADENDNKPVYIGGIDRDTGEFRAVKVDAQGRLDFASTIEIGAVTIADGGDVAQGSTTDAPVTDPDSNATLVSLIKGLLKNSNGPSDSAITVVPSAVVDTVLLAANANRKGATLFNNSTELLYVALSDVDATVNWSVPVLPGALLTLSNSDYTGVVKGVWAGVNGQAIVTEFE